MLCFDRGTEGRLGYWTRLPPKIENGSRVPSAKEHTLSEGTFFDAVKIALLYAFGDGRN